MKRSSRTANGDHITVTAKLRPYFSVTGEIIERGRRTVSRAGCLHDEILAVWPDLAPVVLVHLSDRDGTPMHAHANALYFMGLAGYQDARDLDALARHLRVSRERAEEIESYVRHQAQADRASALQHVIETALHPMWKEQADAALDILDAES